MQGGWGWLHYADWVFATPLLLVSGEVTGEGDGEKGRRRWISVTLSGGEKAVAPAPACSVRTYCFPLWMHLQLCP